MHQVPCIKTQGGHMPVSPSNRRQWLAMGTALISLSCAASAASTTYPSKPLRILVPYAAGGASDNIARQIAAAITGQTDRKSTRLNSSHLVISYAVFCFKKKKRSGHREARPPALRRGLAGSGDSHVTS